MNVFPFAADWRMPRDPNTGARTFGPEPVVVLDFSDGLLLVVRADRSLTTVVPDEIVRVDAFQWIGDGS